MERPDIGAPARFDEPGAPGPAVGAASSPAALADRIATIAAGRKAIDVRVLDLREIVSYTDYFVICSGNTDRQTRAIHEAIYRELKDAEGLLPKRVEGDGEARWILLDYLDCVVHVFTPDARSYYRLEQLWGEAPARAVD
jgi:ribosome-associated protein